MGNFTPISRRPAKCAMKIAWVHIGALRARLFGSLDQQRFQSALDRANAGACTRGRVTHKPAAVCQRQTDTGRVDFRTLTSNDTRPLRSRQG